MAEVRPEDGIVQDRKLLRQFVQFVEGVLLELVAQIHGHVALDRGPGDGVRHLDGPDALEVLDGLGRRHELHRTISEHLFREGAHEVEDAARGGMEEPEDLIVHEEVHDVALGAPQPLRIFLRRQRPDVPVLVGEAHGDVVAQRIVPQEQVQFRLRGAAVHVIGIAPAQDLLGTFGQHGLEAHVIDRRADGVGIDHFRIAESDRLDAEQLLELVHLLEHLVLELGLGGHGSQGMVIGLAEELDLAGVRESLETLDDFGGIALEEFERGTRNGEGELERAFVGLQQVEQDGIHREIALLNGPPDDIPVGKVIVVVGIFPDVEKTVLTQPGRLMYREKQADALLVHNRDS